MAKTLKASHGFFISLFAVKVPFSALKLFDGNPRVIITIGCVATDRLRESPPLGKCKHNVLVVFDC